MTLWWSDTPDQDFGADRPNNLFSELDPVWRNYKMHTIVDYEELDPNPAQWFSEYPSLAASLSAVQSPLSWASNPYIEHGRGNAKTNCIGCHQHGGSTVGHDLNSDGQLDAFDLNRVITDDVLFPDNGRRQIRTLFPADYLWSIRRMDNLSEVMASEVRHYDRVDNESREVRAKAIMGLGGDASNGAAIFANHCTGCHGREGKETAITPSLFERVPALDDQQRAMLLLSGKDQMPSWSQLDDSELADVLAFIASTFTTQAR